MNIQIMWDKKQLITRVLKNTWDMFRYEFPQSQAIIPVSITTICNCCDKFFLSGDTLYDGVNVE